MERKVKKTIKNSNELLNITIETYYLTSQTNGGQFIIPISRYTCMLPQLVHPWEKQTKCLLEIKGYCNFFKSGIDDLVDCRDNILRQFHMNLSHNNIPRDTYKMFKKVIDRDFVRYAGV
jgi:hypothetical protein